MPRRKHSANKLGHISVSTKIINDGFHWVKARRTVHKKSAGKKMTAWTPANVLAISLPVQVNVDSKIRRCGWRAFNSRINGATERTSPTDDAWIQTGLEPAMERSSACRKKP